jgi:hypothetical protein
MKPYRTLGLGVFAEAEDNLSSGDVRWPLLNPSLMNVFGRSTGEAEIIADQNHIWGDGQDHSWETRSWAELAYWYPAFTVPAGAQPVNVFTPVARRNFDMKTYGGDDGGISVLSHGYLKAREFWKVFGAYGTIGELFEEP